MIWSILCTRSPMGDQDRRWCCSSQTNSDRDVEGGCCQPPANPGWRKTLGEECWPKVLPDLPSCWGHRCVVVAVAGVLQGRGRKILRGGWCRGCRSRLSAAPDWPWSSWMGTRICCSGRWRRSSRTAGPPRWRDPKLSNRSLCSSLEKKSWIN